MSYMVPQRVYILQSKLIKSQDVFNGAKRSAARLWLVNIYIYITITTSVGFYLISVVDAVSAKFTSVARIRSSTC